MSPIPLYKSIFTFWTLTLLTVLAIMLGLMFLDSGRTTSGLGALWFAIGFGAINLFLQVRALLTEYRLFIGRKR